jgi:hypothetical protein
MSHLLVRRIGLAVLLLIASSVAFSTLGCGGSDDVALIPDGGSDAPTDGSETTDGSGGDGAPADGATTDGAADGGADAADANVLSLSINSVALAEGNSGTKAMTFTVTLSAASTKIVTVAFATADGTATSSSLAVGGADYVATSGTVTFGPGDKTKTLNVYVRSDVTPEPNETFTLKLSNAVNASIAQGVGTGTIEDDDGVPSISIGNALVTEGNTGTTPAVFNLTLSAPSSQTVTVHAKTTDGAGAGAATAADNDYTPIADTTVTFNPGETAKTVTVSVVGDTTTESNETFTVDLSSPTNAIVGTASGTATIQNDDGVVQPSISIADATVTEGNAGTKTMTFAVTLSASSTQTVTVDFKTTDGTATAIGVAASGGQDYGAASNTLTFAPGVTSQVVSITINGDILNEDNEGFTVDLSNATNAIISKVQGAATITNDDGVPTLAINSTSVAEGQAGSRALTFTISLSNPSGKTVTVGYTTSDGTATSGGSSATGGLDFVASTGTISFPPGTSTQTLSIIVNGDALNEANETLGVAISSPVNATLSASTTGVGTITNDDPLPLIVINDVSLVEGNAGTSAMIFSVDLVNASLAPAPSGRALSVGYATAGGTATSGTDFVATSGTINFAAGQTTQFVAVQINGDTTSETNEKLTVSLSNAVNASIADAAGDGTIIDDDGSLPFLNVADTSVTEGNAGSTQLTFTVSLSAAAAQDVTVDYATADGTAVSGGTLASGGQDYVPASGTLTFTPGQTSKTVSVTVNGDLANEDNDALLLVLSNVASANATIQDGSASGTIANDDTQPSVSIGNATSSEGNAGTSTASFTVTLSAISGQPVEVSYATADGSAQVSGTLVAGGQDYAATSGTLTFAPGETTKTILVTLNGDTTFEPSEDYGVTLSAPLHATLGTGTGTGTIANDDPVPSITIDDVTLAEGTPTGTTAFTFTVTLSNASVQTVTVNYQTLDGTATHNGAQGDYVLTIGTLSIPPGATTGTITVPVQKDSKIEADETFSLNLSGPTNATILDASGLGTITNDD